METKIVVENLKCGGCANAIKKYLQNLDGVLEVVVDVSKSEVIVSHEAVLNKKHFLRVLCGLGYPESGSSTSMQKVRSYVSCAKGRWT